MGTVGDGDIGVTENEVQLQIHVGGMVAVEVKTIRVPLVGMDLGLVDDIADIAGEGGGGVVQLQVLDGTLVAGTEFVGTAVFVGLLPSKEGKVDVPVDEFTHNTLFN